jgi:tripartite motif-containing protein 71
MGGSVSLMEPSDITVNKLGEIFIADRELNGIMKLSDSLQIISFEGGIGSDLGDFNRPSGLDCDAVMNLYVADPGNRRIQVLDRNLRPANDIKEYFQKDGSSEKFDFPEDVAVDLEGNVWVADDDRVLKINPFNELELELSYTSIERLDIGKAVSLAVSPAGNIAIGDSGNRKIYVVSSYGNLISEFPVASVSSVAWEGNNTIWISSSAKRTISAYDISGVPLFVYSDLQNVSRPVSIAVAGEGMLIAVDEGNRKIVRLEIIRNKTNQSER